MKNMKKKNAIIIAVVAVVLVLGIGFALFSETVNINGTVKAEGNMDVEFFEVGAITEKVGYTQKEGTFFPGTGEEAKETTIAKISSDGNTLQLNVNNLEYPGAKVVFPVTIKNVGSIPVVFESITLSPIVDSTSKLKLSYIVDPGTTSKIESGGTQTLTFTAEWVEDAENVQQSSLSISNIDIKLNYKQISAK